MAAARTHGKVLKLLLGVRRRFRLRRTQTALLWWTASLPLFLLFPLIEHFSSHEAAFRDTLGKAFVFAVVVWLLVLCVLLLREFVLLRNTPHLHELARRIGWGRPEIRDRLLNGLQVVEAGERNAQGYDPELIAASLDSIVPQVDQVDPAQAIPKQPRRRALIACVTSLLLSSLLLFVGWDAARLASLRILQPQHDFLPPPPYHLSVATDTTTVVAGRKLTLRIEAQGSSLPQELILHQNGPQGARQWPLLMQRGQAELADHVLHADAVFWAETENWSLGRKRRILSDTLALSVLKPPSLYSFRVSVHPLAYTGQGKRELEEGSADLVCPIGSRIEVQGRVSERLLAGTMHFSGEGGDTQLDFCSDSLANSLDFSFEWRARRDGRWWLELLDEDSLRQDDMVIHSLRVIPDRPPRLRMVHPQEQEIELDRRLRLPLVGVAEDDYAVTRLRMIYKRVSAVTRSLHEQPDPALLEAPPEGWEERELELRALGGPSRAALDFTWQLLEENLMPDDEVWFYLEVFDNNGWLGAQSTRTPLYMIKVPGVSELFAEVDRDQEELAEEAEEILRETQRNTEQLRELSEELKRNPEMSWEQQQRLNQLVQQQQETMERAAEVAQQLEQLEQRMENNNLVSEDLREKLARLKELLNEAISPELMERLRKAAEQAQQPQQPQQKRMGDMEEVLREMERQLDRFLAVMEQLRLEQRLEELARRAEDLLERQQQINETAQNPSARQSELQQAAADEERASGEMEELERDVSQLSEEFGQRSDFPREQIERTQEHLQESQPASQMQQMAQQMPSSQAQAGQQGEKIEQDLAQLSENLHQALTQARQNAQEELAREIDRLCQELLVLSLSQEEVNAETPTLSRGSLRLPQLAEQSQEIRMGAEAVADAVVDLSRQSFFIDKRVIGVLGQALESLAQILESYHERNLGQLRRAGPQTMGRFNTAILMLKQSKEQMQQSSSSSGFEELMEQMAQISSQQQCLNGQCNKLMCNKPGNGEKPMSISFGEAASGQSEIRQQMEGLSEKLGEEGNPVLGDTGKISSDMREVERDLENQIYTERTQRLQERIMSRLLEAQRSLRRQDESKKRKSRSAEQLHAPEPPPLPDAEEADRLERDLMRALQEGYSPDMEQLIRDYFEARRQLDAEPLP